MPYTPPVTFADGTAMTWADVESNLAAFRTWVNAIPVADITTASIGRDAIVRPQIAGWPTQGLFGDLQSFAWDDYGPSGVLASPDLGDDTAGGDAWGQEPQRITLMPGIAAVVNGRILTRFGRTFWLHDRWDHDVQIHITGNARIRATTSESSPAGTDAFYPDGAGGPASAVDGLGFLQVYQIDRSTGTETPYTTGRAKLYSPDQHDPGPGTAFRQQIPDDRFHVVYYARLAGGRYLDFVLGYDPANKGRIVQIDLTNLSFTAEVS